MRMKSVKHRDDFSQWVGHNNTQVENPYFSVRVVYGTFLLFLKKTRKTQKMDPQGSLELQYSMFVLHRSYNAE